MANSYKTQGSLALKPEVSQNTADIIVFPAKSRRNARHAMSVRNRSIMPASANHAIDVVSILSCFEGMPFAKTQSERKYAIAAGIIGTLSLFVLSFGVML